jgi:chromosome segregation ATPase
MLDQLAKLRANYNKIKKEIESYENTIKNAEKERNRLRKYKNERTQITPLRMNNNRRLREAMRFHSNAINRANREIYRRKMSLNRIQRQHDSIIRQAMKNGIIAKP